MVKLATFGWCKKKTVHIFRAYLCKVVGEETCVTLLHNQKSKKERGGMVRLVVLSVGEKTYSKHVIFCKCLYSTEQQVMVT